MSLPHSDLDPQDKRRAQIRASKARHDARLKEMTKLEQAAYMERKALGEEKSPYTGVEQMEAEAIRALLAEAQERAQALNHTISYRLTREAQRNEGKAALLTRFAAMQGQRVDLPAF